MRRVSALLSLMKKFDIEGLLHCIVQLPPPEINAILKPKTRPNLMGDPRRADFFVFGLDIDLGGIYLLVTSYKTLKHVRDLWFPS